MKAFLDQTKYKSLVLGPYHNKGDVKTRKRWFDIYMRDVKDLPSDFKIEE